MTFEKSSVNYDIYLRNHIHNPITNNNYFRFYNKITVFVAFFDSDPYRTKKRTFNILWYTKREP